MSKLACLPLLLLLITLCSVLAADYYVALSGSDTTGTGSQANPFLTIAKGIQSAKNGGDTVYVQAGNYSVVVSSQFGGNASAGYISYKAIGRVEVQGFSISHPYVHIEGFYCSNYAGGFYGHITVFANGI